MTYIVPGSPEWAAMISPSKVASILGVLAVHVRVRAVAPDARRSAR